MRSLRRPVLIGTALSALVALPALLARPWADERFVMYMPEHLVGGNPLLLWDQVMREVTAFIDVGVFRPLSRLAFYLEHWMVVRTGIAAGVAPNVVMSLVKVAMIALLLATGVATVNQYRRAAGSSDLLWARIGVLLPVVFAGSLVLVNPAVHPLTLFPGLYLGTATVALLAPLWLGRNLLRRDEATGWVKWLGFGLAALYGAVLASMIELAWLGLPLALIHLAMLQVQRSGWRNMVELHRYRAFRLWIAMAAGFVVVFLPARFFIIRYCATGGCYDAAAPSLGVDFFVLFPFRVGSAFAPVGLLAQFKGVVRMMTRPSSALLISYAVALLAGLVLYLTWRASLRTGRTAEPSPVRALVPLVVFYASVIVMAATLSAISSGLQAKGLNPAPWRETGFGWIAWAVIISAGLAWTAGRVRSRVWSVLAMVLIVLTFAATTVINREDMRRVAQDEEGILHITAGKELVRFEESGNDERCDTIAGLRAVAPNENELRKMDLVAAYLDSAARNNYGVPFCDKESS